MIISRPSYEFQSLRNYGKICATLMIAILATACDSRPVEPVLSGSQTVLVKTPEAYRAALKDIAAGDTIILANGEWRDFEVLFTGKGDLENPITLTAENKGEVVLTGQSNLRLAGEHLVVEGLVFKDGFSPTNAVVEFRRNKDDLANHSTVREIVIDGFTNPERFETDSWVMMYGRNNRFEHNHLSGKGNQGVAMAVRLNTEASRENNHIIANNYFGPRSNLGSNGGETLRIGTSHHSLFDSKTIVEKIYLIVQMENWRLFPSNLDETKCVITHFCPHVEH